MTFFLEIKKFGEVHIEKKKRKRLEKKRTRREKL